MAQIGTFTRGEDGTLSGTIRTLSLNVKARLIPTEPSQNGKAPDLRVLAGMSRSALPARGQALTFMPLPPRSSPPAGCTVTQLSRPSKLPSPADLSSCRPDQTRANYEESLLSATAALECL